MINTNTVRTQLGSILTAAGAAATLNRVLDFSAVLDADLRTTSMLWVRLDAEEASANALDIGISQKVEAQFSIIYASDDLDSLDVLRGIVRSGLLGWTPNSADITAAPFEFRSGALSSEMNEQTADIVWWVDMYATTYLTRAV